jgi:hypothetical protein
MVSRHATHLNEWLAGQQGMAMALIKHEEVDTPDAGVSGVGLAPFWACDTCGGRITGDRPGIAVFEIDGDRNRLGPFQVVHKGGFPRGAEGCETPRRCAGHLPVTVGPSAFMWRYEAQNKQGDCPVVSRGGYL